MAGSVVRATRNLFLSGALGTGCLSVHAGKQRFPAWRGDSVAERSRFLFVPRKQKQWLRETRRFDVRFHDVDDGDRAIAAHSPMQQDYAK